MSQDLERIYTINLGKVLLSQSQHRAVRAINMIREFARHHMKVNEIKIEEDLAHQIWARGIRRPPRKIRVRLSITEEGHVLVSSYSGDAEDSAPEPATIDSPTQSTAQVDEPKVDTQSEPSAESAQVDEPKVDTQSEPSAESAQVDEPKVDTQSEPSAESAQVDEPKVDTQSEPSAESAQVDEPKVDTQSEPDKSQESTDSNK